jgi:3D (Asp-Asp-Asp) domain-containing protein
MKRTQLFLLWLFYFASFCAQNTSQGAAITTKSTDGPQGRSELRTTACTLYTRSRHNAAKNANSSHLKSGDLNSAAADWSRFPLGIKFKICGTHQTYVVDDYGPALVGTNKIDLYMPSLREMHHWGVRKVTINIIEAGSYDRSLALLKPRKHMPYVRRMVKVLEEKV